MSLNNDCAPDTEEEENYSLSVNRPLPGARQQQITIYKSLPYPARLNISISYYFCGTQS